MKYKDVTSLVDFQNNDDECLPITQCVCGKKFSPWSFIISIYEDGAYACPNCGRKFFFRLGIRVFQVEDDHEEVQTNQRSQDEVQD